MSKTEYSDFRIVKIYGSGPLDYRATAYLKAKTKSGWFKKTVKEEVIEIHKVYAGVWFFVSTGKACGYVADDMQRSYEAKHGKSIWDMVEEDYAYG